MAPPLTSNAPRQGYIVLATGSRFYVEMAINLAISIKINDPTRPICLILDEGSELPEIYRPFIDFVRHIKSKPGFYGCLNKLRIHELSPFVETMFVDADCILVKRDMDRHWEKYKSPGFSIAGDTVLDGHWYGFSVQKAIKLLEIPYLVKLNSGIFYFKKGAETDHFFQTALSLVSSHNRLLGKFHRNKLQLADEPFIGAAMGKLGMDPISYSPEEGTIMVTTIRSKDAHFDPFSATSEITIKTDFRILGRFLPRTEVRHSPTFAHFVKLEPIAEYRRVSNQLRKPFNIPSFEVS